MKRVGLFLVCLIFLIQSAYAAEYYVSLNGNDGSGDGSSGRPWRTLQHAVSRVPANQGHTIRIQAGTFVESAYINVPTGVNIVGAGIGVTILKPASNLYYKSGAWLFDKFLISFTGGSNAGQTISDLTVDGESKNLYGGIVVKDRNNVIVKRVRVQYTYLTGIWIWNTLDCRVTEVQFKDCAFGDARGAAGALQISLSERLEIDHCNIDEGLGNGVDGIGGGKMYYLKFHDNRISVNPVGTWKTPSGGNAPNISVEFYNIDLKGCEMYNNYFDNTVSLAMDEPKFAPVPNGPTIRVYDNVFDIITRAGGSGYALELTLHNAEVDHNYFWGGSTSIVNWDASSHPHQMQNWKIHHNTFHAVASGYPTAIIGMVRHGINNAHIYNNTVELSGTATVHFLEVNNGGVANNVKVENNLIIDSNSSYQWGPNKFLSVANGASFQNSIARNNFFQKMSMNTLPGVTYTNNKSGDPAIQRSGNRPDPFYAIKAGSPLIDQGVNLGFAYSGTAPDIGAYEFGGTSTPANKPPVVSITGPSNNASFTTGSTVSITANASDSDGTVSKVEFFQGSTKLGEDTSSPYAFSWTNVVAENYQITAKATDNAGATTTSPPISISVKAASAPAVSITAPANNASYNAGATVTINAAASDQGGTITKVEFYRGTTKLGEDTSSPYSFVWSNALAGNYQLTAKATDNSGSSTTSAVINISIVTATNKVPTINITSPANNATFNAGTAIPITATSADPDGQITKIEFFRGTTKLGEDNTSPYSFTWNNATAGTYKLTAKTTDNKAASVTSAPITVVVKAPGTNPTVNITSPANNAAFNAGAGIPITVFATDADGQIVKVEFFNGTNKLGEDTSSPHTFTWNNAPAGTYKLVAKTTDNSGLTGSSAPVTVTVKSTAPVPVVAITSPGNNSKFSAGDAVRIAATASVTGGKISKVEFYNGSAKLGQDATSPYGLTWYNVPTGAHKITAKAIDGNGRSANSAIVNVTVNTLPLIAFTSPLHGDIVPERSNVTLKATASDPDGTIAKVEFFRGNTKIGEDTSSPYTCEMLNVKSGAARIVARATDNSGAVAKAQITLNINALPTVKITTPVNKAAFKIGTIVNIVANALDRDGRITKVEFFAGAAKLGEDTSSPYNFAWKTSALGTYNLTVKATDNRGATRTSTVVVIKVLQNVATPTDDGDIIIVNPGEESQVKIPRVFSPNDDGINDVWEWENMEQYEHCTLSVFNRIGNKIYETTSYQNGWDGKVDGKPLPEDAYYYVITCDNNEIMGAVRIVR